MIDSSSPLPQAIGAVLARETPTGQVSVDLLRVQQHISKIASTSADPRRALVELAAAIGTAFQVEGCSILYSASAGSDSYAIHWKVNALMLPVQTLSISSFPDKAAPSDLTIVPDMERLSNDGAIDPWFRTVLTSWQVTSSPTATPSVIGAALAISTRFHDQVNGRISLMRTHPHSWTTTEIEALTSVSQQVAIVLSHLQLQQQLQQQLQHQAVVNQLTMAIRNSSDITDILNLATNGTSTALQVQRGLLLRLKYWDPLFRSRSSTQTPKVRVTVVCEWFNPSERMGLFQGDAAPSDHSIEFPSALNQSFWLSECALCQYAFKQSGAPIVVNDSRELPGFDSSIGIASVFALEELPAVLMAPLESQGTVLGFLVFQLKQPRSWQPNELELVELVSAQVSTAIIQTETLRQVQGLVEKRTAELQESLGVQAKLYERTRQQIDQLRHLNQLKDEFLSTVNHELRTPLTSMTMAIRMLRQPGLSDDRSARYLDILEQQCAQETNLINDLLALQELESKQVQLQLEELDLKALIEDLAATFSQKWAAKGLSLVLDLPSQPLRLRSDRGSLNRVLLELLTNAGKYSDPNTRIALKVVHPIEQATHEVVLTLSNTGPGIAPDELPYIFDKFRRAQGATQNAVQGTGLGLALVKCLVQHLNGAIAASSCPTSDVQCCETCFTLTLPQVLDGKI